MRKKYGVDPGVETPITSDEPGVLDGDGVVKRVGAGGCWRQAIECVGLIDCFW
jgi:hypothetical protein